ncbi:MAG TPA: VOC family protein [Lacunisphaera sp.]|nr:VOC family protein [Lacunisphaera sp.]
MSIRRVVPDISSGQMVQSRKFYTEFLGFDVGMDMGWIVTFVSPQNPTAQLTIVQAQAQMPTPAVSIEVSDVDAVYARAAEQGIKIVYPLTTEPWGVRRFFAADPNGVILNILSHAKNA